MPPAELCRTGSFFPETAVIPTARRADWYARRVGVAAAREINEIPAARPPTEESRLRAAGIIPIRLKNHPFTGSDRCDTLSVGREPIPCVAAGANDVSV